MPTHQKCGSTWNGSRVQHCAAPGCCLTFSGTTSGDHHRVGEHHITDPTDPNRRRCLTIDEMTDRGMRPNAYGYWGMGETYGGPTDD